jgi:hypothetical protein
MDYEPRMTILLQQINASDPKARRDLIKMYGNCRGLMDRISMELVTCRRLHKPTPALQELVTQLDAMLEMLEQNITFAYIAF